MLEIKNLYKDFNGFQVLEDLNWKIDTGRVVGLIGANGSGKSTLLRCIAGVYGFDRPGKIYFDQKPIDEERQRIVFVPDEPFYLAKFTTREMTNFYSSFYKNFSMEEYQHLLEVFDFDDKKPIHQLSKGLKRQAALILSLSCQPDLLMMDESFDGLDPRMRLALKKELARLVSDREITVIISSHNIRELEDICDVLSLLENRKIYFTRTIEELNEDYHKVQLGYKGPIDEAFLKSLNPLSMEVHNRVVSLVFKGEEEMNRIYESHPALVNPLPLSMEEIFVIEMENKDRADKEEIHE